jgi:hypothetical protein
MSANTPIPGAAFRGRPPAPDPGHPPTPPAATPHNATPRRRVPPRRPPCISAYPPHTGAINAQSAATRCVLHRGELIVLRPPKATRPTRQVYSEVGMAAAYIVPPLHRWVSPTQKQISLHATSCAKALALDCARRLSRNNYFLCIPCPASFW